MVQFGTKLQTNKNPQWTEKYVDYDKLKKIVKKVAKMMEGIRKRSINLETAPGYSGEDVAASDDEGQGLVRGKSLRDSRSSTVDEYSSLLTRKRANTGYNSASGSLSGDRGKVVSLAEEPFNRELYSQILQSNPDEEFIKAVKQEAGKVEAFYEEQIDNMKKRLYRLQVTISRLKRTYLRIDPDVEEEGMILPKEALTADSAKRAFRDIYRELKFLQNYTILNYTAFIKIFKKHDKATGLKTGKRMMKLINKYRNGFVESPQLMEMVNDTETIVAKAFYSGNIMVARSELLMKQHRLNNWEMMHIGLRIGMVLILCCWVIWDVSVDTKVMLDPLDSSRDRRTREQMDSVLRIFRGFGFFVMCFWLWPICVYMWTSGRINYIYLFEFDPRRSLLWEEALSRATSVTLVYLSLMLGYVKVSLGGLGDEWFWLAKYFPVVLFAYMCTLMVFPLSQTTIILDTLFKVVSAPMHEVTFLQSFLADILTSMARPLVDVAFTFCFFFSGDWHRMFDMNAPINHTCQTNETFIFRVAPFVISMPLMFRIFQNLRRYHDTKKRFPHLLNAFKYFLAQQLVLLGALHPVLVKSEVADGTVRFYKTCFIFALVSSTLFTYYWDVRMDWGIRTFRPPHLRGIDYAPPAASQESESALQEPVARKLLLPDIKIYYIGVVLDFFLRFTWSLTLIPNKVLDQYIDASHLNLFLGTAELMRRTLWCIIRVEYEHAHNEHEYRRVEHIPSLFEQDDDRHDRAASKYSVFAELGMFSGIVVFFFAFAFMNEEEHSGGSS